MTSSNLDNAIGEREEAARRYVEQLRAFYIHACMYAVGMFIMFTVNLLTNLSAGIAGEWTAWWSAWALLGWGLGIVVHGLVVWLNRPSVASSTWEQRQIEKMLGR
ncbi:MAG: 2TM domain-containing protein [Acidimicrobiales bacterium]|nr:2TM domain-containing protein [Acidimicrobiales bacterium]